MKYLLLIYGDPAAMPETPEEGTAEMQAYFAFTEEVAKAGVLVGGEPLQGIETATTVRVRDGKTMATDGPFAETKEVLGGYYLLDCKDLDEAIKYAAKIPGAKRGSIEVRPLMEIPDIPH